MKLLVASLIVALVVVFIVPPFNTASIIAGAFVLLAGARAFKNAPKAPQDRRPLHHKGGAR